MNRAVLIGFRSVPIARWASCLARLFVPSVDAASRPLENVPSVPAFPSFPRSHLFLVTGILIAGIVLVIVVLEFFQGVIAVYYVVKWGDAVGGIVLAPRTVFLSICVVVFRHINLRLLSIAHDLLVRYDLRARATIMGCAPDART